LFPNPSEGSVTIAMTDAADDVVTVRVVNSVGSVVYAQQHTLSNGRADLSLQNATPGMYILQLTTSKGEVKTGRVVIMK